MLGFLGGIAAVILGSIITDNAEHKDKAFYYGWIASGICIGALNFINYYKPKKPTLSPEMSYALQKMEEIHSSLVNSGRAGEATKLTLVVSANSTKHELERLWGRSRVAFAMGCFFLCAALSGSLAAIWLVTKYQDWRYFLASMSSSAVMLTAAAVLFRHENRLRSQYRLSIDEIAYFDRLRFAIDCSRVISEEAHKETLKQIIGYLVTPGPVLAAASKAATTEEKESLDSPLDVAGKIVEASAKIAESALDGARKSAGKKP